ncbi:MAG: Uma2 family endonuclease [Deltaproteobacteria bacterium]|nr:Uma2 family endonuclease [Deltaproteobacteria bacterium]
MPEDRAHFELRTALFLTLQAAFRETAVLGSDQFVYWDPTDPTACVAPDLFVRLGGPDESFKSWKTWERGAPELAVEIISDSDEGDAPTERVHVLEAELARRR